jgi:hypothetical protein
LKSLLPTGLQMTMTARDGSPRDPAATAADAKRKPGRDACRRRRKRPSSSMAAVLQGMRQQVGATVSNSWQSARHVCIARHSGFMMLFIT